MRIESDALSSEMKSVLHGRNIVLITGSSTVDSRGVPVYLVVKEMIGERLKAIWSLQHGFFIDKQDNMVLSDSFYWSAMGLEVKSLYGESLLPQPQWIEGIDGVLVDVFDVGTRVYTFLNHLVMIMKWLSGRGIPMIILDRPAPLNGLDVEGPIISEDYFSIIGQLPVPMRHCLTAGEYASFALSYYGLDLELEIVKARYWKRRDWFKGNWPLPSPNMPSFKTALVYPGAVMLEGTSISEGRGTTRPFELVGAPYIDPFALVKKLEKLQLPGFQLTPMFFKPEFSKFKGEICQGIMVIPITPETFESFAVYYEIIRLVAHDYKDEFRWKQPPYEFENTRLPMDMICGKPFIRESIENNRPFSDIKPLIEQELLVYKDIIADYLLY